jgi:hypothetical protein
VAGRLAVAAWDQSAVTQGQGAKDARTRVAQLDAYCWRVAAGLLGQGRRTQDDRVGGRSAIRCGGAEPPRQITERADPEGAWEQASSQRRTVDDQSPERVGRVQREGRGESGWRLRERKQEAAATWRSQGAR